jgi:O-antigen/teichoic acid export membrane protein
MSKDDFATYSYLSFCVIGLSSVLFFGSETVVSSIFYRVQERKTLNWTIFILALITHILFFGFLLSETGNQLLAYLFDLNLTYRGWQTKLLITIGSFVTGYLLLFNRHFAFNNRFTFFQIWNLIRLLIVNCFLVFGVLFFWGEINFYNRLAVENLGYLLFFIILFYFYFKNSKLKFDFKISKDILLIGGPMIFVYVLNLFFVVFDKFLIQEKFNKSLLASYNLSLLLVYPLGLLFTTYFDVFWNPKFFKEEDININFKNTKVFLIKYMKLIFAFFPVFILFVFLYLYLTSNYDSYGNVLWMCAILYFVRTTNFFSQFFGNFLIFSKKTSILSITNILILILAIASNFYFIPIYAVAGALFVLLFSEFLRLGILYFYVRNSIKTTT